MSGLFAETDPMLNSQSLVHDTIRLNRMGTRASSSQPLSLDLHAAVVPALTIDHVEGAKAHALPYPLKIFDDGRAPFRRRR